MKVVPDTKETEPPAQDTKQTAATSAGEGTAPSAAGHSWDPPATHTAPAAKRMQNGGGGTKEDAAGPKKKRKNKKNKEKAAEEAAAAEAARKAARKAAAVAAFGPSQPAARAAENGDDVD